MRSSAWMIVVTVAIWFIWTPLLAQNDGNQPWEEYDRHIASRTSDVPLSNDLFKEQVDLYNGRLSFRHVDIDIRGNSALPVTIARTFQVEDLQSNPPSNPMLGDWDLDLPRISGVFASQFISWEWETQSFTWTDQRCSGPRVPPVIGPFFPVDYWYGMQANIPEGGGEILEPSPAVQRPSAGGQYRWVTTGLTWISCLPSIQNSTGEGFLAITSNGTKYWFDWMAVQNESSLDKDELTYSGPSEPYFTQTSLLRLRYQLYATRVEDRFGNWVTYHFSNLANQRARLDRIQSSDGRKVEITYNEQARIASASDGARTWSYHYAAPASSNDYYSGLVGVTLPDGNHWSIGFHNPMPTRVPADISDTTCDNHMPTGGPEMRNVFILTHPSGAVGEFEVSALLHGRSDVPRQCVSILGGGEYSDYVRSYWTNSLIKKRVSGPGLPTMQWEYRYNNSDNPTNGGPQYNPPGSWAPGPYTYTRIEDAGYTYIVANPVCVSDSCADRVTTEVFGPESWSRYTFGNSYGYNEHKLLKIEVGTSPSSISRIEEFTYELTRSGQPFPTPIGISRQYKGDSMVETFLRPLRSKTVRQNGRIFNSAVNSFDVYGRPLSVTKSSSPSP